MQTKGKRINIKSVVRGAAAGVLTTLSLLLVLVLLINSDKTELTEPGRVMIIINSVSGIMCGIRTKASGRGEGSINAVLSGTLYAILCISAALVMGRAYPETSFFIRIIAISVPLSWVAYKINLFKSNKKFRKRSK